jgi:Fur family zinc uptake transcriptional regulator
MAHGLVHRVDSLNAFVGCPTPEAKHAGHFLICSGCGDVSEAAGKAITAAIDCAAGEAGFRLQGHTVELHGLCRRCQVSQVREESVQR